MTDTDNEQTEFIYEDLSPKAKEKALMWFSSTLDYEWWECTYDHAKEDAKAKGFDIEDIRFSGFWSQGDGASWTGSVNLSKFLEHHLKDDNPAYGRYFTLQAIIDEGGGWVESTASIERRGYHYVHSDMMRIDSIGFSGVDYLEAASEERLQADGPLQRANIYQLWQGIDGAALIDELEEWVLKEAMAIADTIYADLEAEHDHLTSEESLIEGAYANGWRFDEDGTLV
jgi:hypothetical protein